MGVGREIRKEYRRIQQLQSIFSCLVMTLAATTTATVKSDTMKNLQLPDVFTDTVALKHILNMQLKAGGQYTD